MFKPFSFSIQSRGSRRGPPEVHRSDPKSGWLPGLCIVDPAFYTLDHAGNPINVARMRSASSDGSSFWVLRALSRPADFRAAARTVSNTVKGAVSTVKNTANSVFSLRPGHFAVCLNYCSTTVRTDRRQWKTSAIGFRNGNDFGKLVRPFRDHDAACFDNLVPPQGDQFVGAVQTIEIQVVNHQAAAAIFMNKTEGGAGHHGE